MERTARQRSPARGLARAVLVVATIAAGSSLAQIQPQGPAYPEGSVPGMVPNPPIGAPGSVSPGDPGPGIGSGAPGAPSGTPGYPGYRPPTAQPPRVDTPRTTAPPAGGAAVPRSGPGAYDSRGSGDGRLPPSVYSRGEERKADPNRLPSSPSGGLGVGSGVGR